MDKTNNYICILDCETTFSDMVMSIGIAIADKKDFSLIDSHYYKLTPEILFPSMYTYSLNKYTGPNTFTTSRCDAIMQIIAVLNSYNIDSIFAYNGRFDFSHLPELSDYNWFDIMRIAAYKNYNPCLPAHLEYCKTGRLKTGYGVENIIRYLTKDYQYFETHNALIDACDELLIMKILNLDCSIYEIGRIK